MAANADPLTIAVRSLDIATFNGIIKANPDLNATDSAGMTALHHACSLGAVEMTTALLNAGADPSCKSSDGKNALHHAVSIAALCFAPQPPEAELTICPLTIPQLLASAGVNLNEKDGNGDAALHLAAKNGLVGVIATLVQAGADPNQKNSAGDTPLHLVGGMLPHICAQVLLLHGADPEIPNNSGLKAADIAGSRKNALLINMIREYAKKIQK